MKHLLEWCDGRFFSDSQFVFFLADQVRRHAVLSASKAHLRDHEKSLHAIRELIESPDCEERLEEAIQDPSSEDAKLIFKKIARIVTTSDKYVPFSHNSSSISQMYSTQVCAGSPYVFCTIAPSDVQNRLMIRLSVHDPKKDNNDPHGRRFGTCNLDFFPTII